MVCCSFYKPTLFSPLFVETINHHFLLFWKCSHVEMLTTDNCKICCFLSHFSYGFAFIIPSLVGGGCFQIVVESGITDQIRVAELILRDVSLVLYFVMFLRMLILYGRIQFEVCIFRPSISAFILRRVYVCI